MIGKFRIANEEIAYPATRAISPTLPQGEDLRNQSDDFADVANFL